MSREQDLDTLDAQQTLDATLPPPDGRSPAVRPPRERVSIAIGGSEEKLGISLREGMRVGAYELIRELGQGGMGQVFLARDTKLGRRVAIKFLLSVGAAASEFVERFLVEARTTAQCNHENIVVIHDVNELQGIPYMVLEYLEGQTLADMLREGPIPPLRAVTLMLPVVRALVRAHASGIVHRDLKPENIFVTSSGWVKVLDFGIAKILSDEGPRTRGSRSALYGVDVSSQTQAGQLVGTVPYMSPEQLRGTGIDDATDIWAIGIVLFTMIAGKHPLAGLSLSELMGSVLALDAPMPLLRSLAPHVPDELSYVVSRCLAKDKSERYGCAQEVLDELAPLVPGAYGRPLSEGESPFPGLSAFQESDADRFFGRGREVLRLTSKLRERPLVGLIGPSGAGKSSLVRAGVIPALKASDASWLAIVTRPGRRPLDALASALLEASQSAKGKDSEVAEEHADLVAQFRAHPGAMGSYLRTLAQETHCRIVLFVDQLEELYTLVSDAEERSLYTQCLGGIADDASTPLRVVVSMRSDFVDRTAEHPEFMEELTQGLVFLVPPDRRGLREALTLPLELVGYRFESPELVVDMLDALSDRPGALPLLQFAATQLWEQRNRESKVLSRASYRQIGGVEGALASHASQVFAGLAIDAQRTMRMVFQRLVTPDGTRAIVDMSELLQLGSDSRSTQRLLDHLATQRLLVVQTETAEPTVEIVHESLIQKWPILRRWLDESNEHVAFIAQLRAATQQWQNKGRDAGLLWTGEAAEEAGRWASREELQLPKAERDYLAAVVAKASRSRRIRRGIATAVVAGSLLVAAGAVVAMLSIRAAEKTAEREARAATEAREDSVQKESVILSKEQERAEAAKQAKQFMGKAEQSREQLAQANEELRRTASEAELQRDTARTAQKRAEVESEKAKAAKKRAEEAALKAEEATRKVEALLKKERERVQRLQKERGAYSTDLN